MLTQKGREPFIRMKLFLDDEHAVHKLVASQYKIAPEKLMRTGSYGGASPCKYSRPLYKALDHGQITIFDFITSIVPPGCPKQMPKLPDFPRSLPEGPMLPSSLRFGGPDAASLLDRPPMLDPLILQRKLLSQKIGGPGGLIGGPAAAIVSAAGALGGAPNQSLYEMAALTHEMDTQAVTTKIKEILADNNIGQKVRTKYPFTVLNIH